MFGRELGRVGARIVRTGCLSLLRFPRLLCLLFYFPLPVRRVAAEYMLANIETNRAVNLFYCSSDKYKSCYHRSIMRRCLLHDSTVARLCPRCGRIAWVVPRPATSRRSRFALEATSPTTKLRSRRRHAPSLSRLQLHDRIHSVFLEKALVTYLLRAAQCNLFSRRALMALLMSFALARDHTILFTKHRFARQTPFPVPFNNRRPPLKPPLRLKPIMTGLPLQLGNAACPAAANESPNPYDPCLYFGT